MIGAVLVGALASAGARAQASVTEKEAATYVYGGFLTDSAHAILSTDVKLGPELRRRLALPPGADSRTIYEALVALTDPKVLAVRKAGADEVSRYARRTGSELKEPLFALESGETTLLIQYDLEANNIPFVGQLTGPPDAPAAIKPAAPAPAEPLKPLVAPPPPKPRAAAAEKPGPRPVQVQSPPPAPRVAPLKPTGPCEVKPVMSDQDLVNCGATPR